MEYTQSLAQGLDILLLYDSHTSFLTAAEISKKKGYSLSKTYRIIRTLMKHGFIEEEKGTARYVLGLNVFRLGLLAQKKFTLAAVAKPLMKELSVVSKESVVLTAVSGTKAVCIENVESEEAVRSSTFQAGESRLLHAGASSKILMAYLSEKEWDDIIATEGLRRFTSSTITQAKALKEHLRETRKKGYAVSDREVYKDVRAVGAPILDGMGRLIGGLSIVGPVYRINKIKLNHLVKLVLEYAGRISEQMGCADLGNRDLKENNSPWTRRKEVISTKENSKEIRKKREELRRSTGEKSWITAE